MNPATFVRYAKRACHLAHLASRRTLWSLRRTFQDSVTIRTRQGVFTASTWDDGIAAPLYLFKEFEYDFSLNAIRFLKDKGFLPATRVTMLDVGANIGIISIGLARAGEIQHALAIEPEPNNFRLLQKNVQQNGLSGRILCLQTAVGQSRSTVTMELSANNAGDHRVKVATPLSLVDRHEQCAGQGIQVDLLPLDEILELADVRQRIPLPPSLLWIDIQGYEGYAFQGAKNLLAGGLPTVSEIWPHGILRAGMSLEEFCRIVASLWTDYWVQRKHRFIRYPTTSFDRYLDELGTEDDYGNVLLTGPAGLGAA